MFTFGIRGVPSSVKVGDYPCPQSNQNQRYRHRRVRKFFTLDFIPIIPPGNAGEYVECRNCKGTFLPKVLERGSKNKEFMALYEKAMRHSMIEIMWADGVIDENEKKVVLGIVNRFGNNHLTNDQLEALISESERDHTDVTQSLKQISSSLNDHGKETIIKCALHVALADGNFDPSEKEMIAKMGTALGMTSSHLKGIYFEIFQQNSA